MPRKKKGGSLGVYCALFAILIVAGYFTYLIFPIEAQAIIIGAGVILLLYIYATGVSAIIMDRTDTLPQLAEPRDPSFIQRVVVDSYTEEEFIISAKPDMSFREACINDWQFSSMDSDSAWIIEDERKNDISDKPLSSYHGISRIVSIEPMQDREIKRDVEDDDLVTDISKGVVFYD